MQQFDIGTTSRRLVAVFMALFIGLSGWIVYWQVYWPAHDGQAIAANYDPRQCVADNVPQRGTIYDRNGKRLAYSELDKDRSKGGACGWRRHYTDPKLAPLIGYYDPTGFGITGLELAYNDILSGRNGDVVTPTLVSVNDGLNRLITSAEHKPGFGNDIWLTIDMDTQDKVFDHFNDTPPCGYPYVDKNRPGSMIVEDPNTGEILAMVSYPIYNNDDLVNHTLKDPTDPQSLTVGQVTWNTLLQDPNTPLLNRPIQTAVVPGSTFKLLTLIAGFDSGRFAPASSYTKEEASTYTVSGHTFVTNNLPSGLTDKDFPIDLIHLFAFSDNVAYARTAVAIGKPTWLDYASRFGMSYGDQVHDIPFDLPVLRSWVYQPQFTKEWNQDNVLFADTGYGQGKLLVTPLMVSMMMSAIAADGKLYAPHLKLKAVAHGEDAAQVPNTAPTFQQVMNPQSARNVQQALRAVVSYGTGALSVRARASLVLEGGKTGTGDLGKILPFTQTWWSSIAPVATDENGAPTGKTPRYAVIIQKDLNGEGFCQSEIALDIYEKILLTDLSGK